MELVGLSEFMKLKCIIFDVDGTMADTERNGHRIAFNLAFKEKGLQWDWDEELYGQLLKVTGGKERMKYFQEDFLHEQILSDEDIKELHACKTRHYVELLQSGQIPLRQGVRELIEQAKESGIDVAIATTTTPVNVTTLLHATLGEGSENLFSVIAAGDVIPNKKPAPDIYIYALQKMGLDAGDCIAIEDSEAGLASSVAAGIKTVVTTNLYTKNQDFSLAEIVKPNLGDVDINLLKKLTGGNHV